MDGFLNKDGRVIVDDMVAVIVSNRAYLSDIDGLIGDGDHGVNMAKGFSMCGDELAGKDASLSESLKCLGNVLMTEIGGSMGPLYGTFFNKMARKCRDMEAIDKTVFGDMLREAAAGVASLGGANIGDKTMMDALVPAVAAYDKALEEGRSFTGCLADMTGAAEAGWLSTKEMTAKIGRAARLGDRSKGVLDAGATSCFLLLQSMMRTILVLLG